MDEIQTKWIKEQYILGKNVVLQNQLSFDSETLNGLKFIGGCDISFINETDDAIVCVIVMSFPSLELIYSNTKKVTLTIPYISGFLGFRESPDILELMKFIPTEIYPQILFVDGNGLLHPRKFGLACQLGLQLKIPTVGIGKKFLVIQDCEIKSRHELKELFDKSDKNQIEIKNSNVVIGSALRNKSKNPIFVSIGNMITLETAIYITQKVSKFRIPEPIRFADLISRDIIRKSMFE